MKLLLRPSSHDADPANRQGAKYAKGQINEIGIADRAEGKNGTQEEVIKAEDRKDNCEHAWPGSCVPNRRGDCEQERRQNGLEMSQQEEIQPDCDCYGQKRNAVPENRRHGCWRRMVPM